MDSSIDDNFHEHLTIHCSADSVISFSPLTGWRLGLGLGGKMGLGRGVVLGLGWGLGLSTRFEVGMSTPPLPATAGLRLGLRAGLS